MAAATQGEEVGLPRSPEEMVSMQTNGRPQNVAQKLITSHLAEGLQLEHDHHRDNVER